MERERVKIWRFQQKLSEQKYILDLGQVEMIVA